MAGNSPDYSIILAGGKGSRMQSDTIPKVCFPVDGIPAINRAIAIYNHCGVKQHIVVTGALAGQVVQTIGEQFDNVVFVYQREQLGTANAVRTALKSLASLDDNSHILLVAGDRIIEPSVLEKLFNLYYTEHCALTLLAVPRQENSSQGRIAAGADGTPLAIIEMADIRQRTAYRELRAAAKKNALPSRAKIIAAITEKFSGKNQTGNQEKLHRAFGRLWELLNSGKPLSAAAILELIPEELTRFAIAAPGGKTLLLSPEEAEKLPDCNNSVYLVRGGELKYALQHLYRDNAQQEEYLSDIVKILCRPLKDGAARKLRMLRVNDPRQVLGFNNPAELLEAERIVRSRGRRQATAILSPDYFRKLGDWRQFLNAVLKPGKTACAIPRNIIEIYGDDNDTVKHHLQYYLPLLEFAGEKIGEEEIVGIVRSPGRVNVMGRHVDHQGGNCNLMTIGFETLMLVHPRTDDKVCLFNLDKEFKTAEFSISELVSDLPWDDWLSLVNSDKLAKLISTYGVDWSHYVKAAILRLQKKFSHTKLRGMDLFISGNVPMAAGLSSSSTLVVGAAEAVVAVNQLDTFPAQLVTLCGEGEWFVGTRGGSADHAAVKMGQKGKVVKVTFFDFAVQDIVPFPEDYVLAVCDSGIKARKSASAKDQFNHRICCYRIGFQLIKKSFPQYAPMLKHLRDVNTRNLGIPLSWIYRILLHLPENATLEELQTMLPDENLKKLCSNHQPPADGLYPIRGVVLFGLSEFERARLYADALKAGKIAEIGQLMNISHDGDRISRLGADADMHPYQPRTSNAYLLKLMEDLESGDPERVINAQLQWQPGNYHCSLTAIDKMVDISLATPGVVGAQLAGAGLGGCMMVLARQQAIDRLIGNLEKDYYRPAGIPTSVLICKPVAGAGLVPIPSDSKRKRSRAAAAR